MAIIPTHATNWVHGNWVHGASGCQEPVHRAPVVSLATKSARRKQRHISQDWKRIGFSQSWALSRWLHQHQVVTMLQDSGWTLKKLSDFWGEDQIHCIVSKCLFLEPKAEWESEINYFSFSSRIPGSGMLFPTLCWGDRFCPFLRSILKIPPCPRNLPHHLGSTLTCCNIYFFMHHCYSFVSFEFSSSWSWVYIIHMSAYNLPPDHMLNTASVFPIMKCFHLDW